MKIVACALLAFGLVSAGGTARAQADAKVKLGFIAAMSGPLAVLGTEQKRGFDIAMQHLGNKLGDLPVEVIIGDSKTNPGATVQELSRLIEKERVDVITGLTASNEVLAAVKPITDFKIFFIGANTGPSEVAGEQCSPYYFNVSFQNAQLTTGLGSYMNKKGVKKLFLIGADYAGSREHLQAARAGYSGDIVGEVYTPLSQMDFGAEIAKIRSSGAGAVFAFYPGGAGVTFVRQWGSSGLSEKIALYGNLALSEPLTFAAQGKAAIGITITGNYFAALENPYNRRFVTDFRAKFKRDPAVVAATQYDAVMLLDSAIRAVKGNLRDENAFRAALRKANFHSVRGQFKFNTNHMPIQDNYVAVVEQRADQTLYLKPIATILNDSSDEFVSKCRMK